MEEQRLYGHGASHVAAVAGHGVAIAVHGIANFSSYIFAPFYGTSASSDHHVYVMGVSGTAELSASAGAMGAIVFDDEGNIGFYGSVSGGVGFFGVSLTGTKGILNLDNIYQLNDVKFTTSVSVGGDGWTGGTSFVFIQGEYAGFLKNIGVGIAGPALDYNVQPFAKAGVVYSMHLGTFATDLLKMQYYASTAYSWGAF